MPHKFLVIRWSGMGDIVMTLPAIRWLKAHFKTCHISYLTDSAFAEILDHSGLVDHVVRIDRRGFASPRRFPAALSGTIAGLFRLRKEKADMAFDLQGFGETAVLAYLSGAPVRVGRIKESFLRKRIYNSSIHADWEKEHRTRYFIRAVAEACGAKAPVSTAPPRLIFKAPESPRLSPLIGLNIGASTESRRWSESNFFALAGELAFAGCHIRFFLGPQEHFLTQSVRDICLKNKWEYSFHARMEPLMRALSQCDLLVSNDTGPGHLAAALGIPVITLFSTGDPENVKPLAEHANWFRSEKDINRISVENVRRASLALLEAGHAAKSRK